MKEPVRILNIVPNMQAAGVESFIMNVYRNIDRKKVQFDFLVHSKAKQFYDDEIKKLGGRIYYLTLKDDKKLIKYARDLRNFFMDHQEYHIIHGHMQSLMPIYLYIAKKCGVKIRIAHAHNNSYERSIKGFILHVLSIFSGRSANVKFACSLSAGRYLFRNNDDFEVIYNGIDLDKFSYNEQKRRKMRKKLGIEKGEILIGNVGRMEKQKNQKFLIDIMEELCRGQKKYKMLIIGEGSLRKKISCLIQKKGLEKQIKILDNVRNVDEYMQAMDIFALPSLYEGLGIVLVEAQANKLVCLATLGSVAIETNITDLIEFLPLKKHIWIEEIKKQTKRERLIQEKMVGREFDIKNVASDLQERYLFYNNLQRENDDA